MKLLICGLVLLLSLNLKATEMVPFSNLEMKCHDWPKYLQIPGGSYCIFTTQESKNTEDVIYYFHGIFSFAHDYLWKPRNRKIREYWIAKGIQVPKVVSISFGKVFLLTKKTQNPNSGLLEKLVQDVLPYLEDKHNLKAQVGKRYCLGHSMGAFQCLQTMLNYPKVFYKVAATNAPLADLSPYASPAQIDAYKKRTGAQDKFIIRSQQVSRLYFENIETWKQNSPLEFARRNYNSHYPPLYLSWASLDHYGFQEGDKLFANVAKDLGGDITFYEINNGTHSDVHAQSLGNFFFD